MRPRKCACFLSCSGAPLKNLSTGRRSFPEFKVWGKVNLQQPPLGFPLGWQNDDTTHGKKARSCPTHSQRHHVPHAARATGQPFPCCVHNGLRSTTILFQYLDLTRTFEQQAERQQRRRGNNLVLRRAGNFILYARTLCKLYL